MPQENGSGAIHFGNAKEVLSLRLLLDRYSVEVFLNGGEKVMSAIFHTPMEADRIVFDTDGTVCMNVVKYDICI